MRKSVEVVLLTADTPDMQHTATAQQQSCFGLQSCPQQQTAPLSLSSNWCAATAAKPPLAPTCMFCNGVQHTIDKCLREEIDNLRKQLSCQSMHRVLAETLDDSDNADFQSGEFVFFWLSW